MPLIALLLMLAPADPPAVRAERARQALLHGQSAEAVRLYRQLVRELPDEPGLRLNLGLALEASGDYHDEIEQLRLVVKRQPELSAAWLMIGMALQKLEQPAQAIAPLQRVLALEPNHEIARFELADAYFASGQRSKALAEYQALAASYPAAAKAWQGLGMTGTALAQDAFAKLDVSAPGSLPWTILAARSQMGQGQYEKAFMTLRDGLARFPDAPELHADLAVVYEKTGHADWAARERSRSGPAPPPEPWEESLKRTDQTPAGLFRQATAYQSLAQHAFDQLARLPDSAELHELLAEAEQRQGRRPEAVAEWRKAARLAPHDSRIAGKLAESLWINRSYDEAGALLHPLCARNPNNPQWRYLLGDILFRSGHPDQALPHLQAAVQAKPDLLAAHAVLGRVYLELNQPVRAVPHLEKGLPVDEAALSFQLGQAYRATGATAAAAKAFARHRALLDQSGEPKPATSIVAPVP